MNNLKKYLEEQYELYNCPSFIENDPIQIPHLFSKKEDIEIAGFLVATIAWGQRKTIINNGFKIMKIMEYKPYEFIKNISKNDLKLFDKFVHRTFNHYDCKYFILSIQNIINNYGSIGQLFENITISENQNIENAISKFRNIFFEQTPIDNYKKPTRHFPNPKDNSTTKRFNMFLRWMVRRDNNGVDFGIWNKIKMSSLMCPIDVHSGRTARELGILSRAQNDWKAVIELTNKLKEFDNNDPVKYDFALFGIGISKKS
jgi:uncharacterized protein (TIGR02757 family)